MISIYEKRCLQGSILEFLRYAVYIRTHTHTQHARAHTHTHTCIYIYICYFSCISILVTNYRILMMN